MEKIMTAIDLRDNGGRRMIRDRRYLVSAPRGEERRTNWERRSGYDRRLRRIQKLSGEHGGLENTLIRRT